MATTIKTKKTTDVQPHTVLLRIDDDPKQVMVHVGLTGADADELDNEIRRVLEERQINDFTQYHVDHIFVGQCAPIDTGFMGIAGVIKNLTDDLDTELVRQVNLGSDNWLLMLDTASGISCVSVNRVQDSYNVDTVMDGVDMSDGFDWLIEAALESNHTDFELIKHMDNPC